MIGKKISCKKLERNNHSTNAGNGSKRHSIGPNVFHKSQKLSKSNKKEKKTHRPNLIRYKKVPTYQHETASFVFCIYISNGFTKFLTLQGYAFLKKYSACMVIFYHGPQPQLSRVISFLQNQDRQNSSNIFFQFLLDHHQKNAPNVNRTENTKLRFVPYHILCHVRT